MNPRAIVRAGYDTASYAYRTNDGEEAGEYIEWLHLFTAALSHRARETPCVVDLGCGCGIPAAQFLVHQGIHVTGIDISPVQIERAKELVPDANFKCADMSRVRFPPESFDGILALYSIIHLPLADQLPLLRSMYRWLRHGGILMATVGADIWTGTEDRWLGTDATMFWSHADRDQYLEWLKQVGFAIAWDRFVPEADGGHTLVFGHKP